MRTSESQWIPHMSANRRYPEIDDLVMVNVRQIAEMGAYVKLVLAATHSRSIF